MNVQKHHALIYQSTFRVFKVKIQISGLKVNLIFNYSRLKKH